MLSPRVLINLSIFVALIFTALFVLLLWLTPYTGFNVEKDPASDYMLVTRVDNWVASQGLKTGDKINLISAGGDSITLSQKHVLTSTFQARALYENRKERLNELAKVYRIVSQPVVTLDLVEGRQIDIAMDQRRPLSSISVSVWIRFFLGLAAPFMGALVWAFRPRTKEAVFLLLSGIGLFIFTVPSAASIYAIEMFYLEPILFWLFKIAGGVGTFIFLGFGTCVLLYYPQKISNADRWSKRLLYGLLVYSLVVLVNDWNFSATLTNQFLYFSYNETYLPMPVFFAVVVTLCVLQWKISRGRPVERAQALWIILAWTLGPSIFLLLYLLPVVLGQEGISGRTLNAFTVVSTYLLVLVGVARFKLFHLEQHIAAAYQWSFVSLFFFGLDIIIVSVASISPRVSTFIVLGLVLWCYLPIRQWITRRVSQSRQYRYQRLFNDAVVTMVQDSLVSVVRPRDSWRTALNTLFSPISFEFSQSEETRVDDRGQTLIVAGNRYSPAARLEFAENGTRLFTEEDQDLVQTLVVLLERLYDFRDAFFAGQTQERERIRRDLHDQIGHKLLSLIYTARDDRSRLLAQETMEQLRELIQALKDEPVSLHDAIGKLRHLSEETCDNVGLIFEWQEELGEEEANISSNQYLNILNIVRELLNNTISHSEASKISVSVNREAGPLTIEVSDNGTGFDQDTVTPGNGLYNIQSRVGELHASIDWHTSSGTRVMLQIPLHNIEEHTTDEKNTEALITEKQSTEKQSTEERSTEERSVEEHNAEG